jgi:CO/xanthine dehydrogenase Mo-binding subunit
MTRDARAALERAGLSSGFSSSRRTFLKGSGALVVGFTVAGAAGRLGTLELLAQAPADRRAQLDAWIAVAADGSVIAYTGKCELGQGLLTAQTQLVAEELGVTLDRVRLLQCDTQFTPDQGTTSGAGSHPANFNQAGLALAAATARQALLDLGAARLGIPVAELAARDGAVVATRDASRRVTYAELVGGRPFDVPLNANARRKSPAEWTILGRPARRLDIPALVTARAEFVHNVRVPGMLHGRPVRPPAVGATLIDVDESSVRGLPGVVKIVTRKNYVGVVAEKPWQAIQAAARLRANWTPGTGLPAQAAYYDHMRTQPSRDTVVVDSGDVDATMATAAQTVRATYLYPYQMHASIGSSCAVADVRAGGVTVWAASQNVYALRGSTATLLGVQPDAVRVVFTRGSGCYGINGADAVAFDAALLSQAVGRPVRVQLSRKDEMAWENFGLAFAMDQQVGLDPQGTIVAWHYEGWSAARGGRPGARPGNVASGFHMGFEPAPFQPRTPAPAPTEFVGDNNTAPSYVAGSVAGTRGGAGTVASERVIAHRVEAPFFTGPLRAPEQLQNTFAHESFMDEVAARVQADPVAYRLRHLRDPRLIDVVRAAATSFGWGARPSPRARSGRAGVATGRGFACVARDGGNGWVAMAAEADVNQDTGEVIVRRLSIACDAGPISNPDGIRNQLEGAALHGISRTLTEEVTWDSQQVTAVDWQTYRSLSLGTPMPAIQTVLMNRTDVPATGAGETSITTVAAAIGNAIFDATGARLRQVPFTPERVKAALAARDVGER